MDCSSTCDVRVTGGGDQVAAHGGLFVLGRFADGLGFGEALSAVVAPGGERAPVHDRGRVLVHALLMLAGRELAVAAGRRAATSSICGPSRCCSGGWRRTRRCIARCGAWAPRRCSRFWLLWRLCAALCGSAAAIRRGLLRWFWTSTRRWWRCTLRTRPARRRISRRGSGSIRCCAPPQTASRCRSCCGAATPRPTTSRTTSTCSTRLWHSSLGRSRQDTARAAGPRRRGGCSCASTPRAARRRSRRPAGSATSSSS